ncbi:ATP-binding protein [Fructilactobacillus sp. Tb1]|uniref:ATP-binding protein n=1 Tax=Fructilactobacillus sp. Tb1 TaxID=3422304 RepID=UPI003D2DB886
MDKIEDNNVEYKSELNKRLKREIVAFLNSKYGGKILLGVDDDTRKNLHIDNDTKHRWEETISSWVSQAFYPEPYSLIEIYPNKDPFEIIVRAGRNKPYCIASEGLTSKGVYIRNGSSSEKASNDQIKRMINLYGTANIDFDSAISKYQDLTFKIAKETLTALGIEFNAKKLKLESKEKYNNAALLISEQNPFLTKLAVFNGLDVTEFKDKKEFSKSIINQINSTIIYLNLLNNKKIIINGNAQREEQYDYPLVALREALINAFVHRDYTLHSDIKVEIYDDRLEIFSPGGIPDGLSLEEIKEGNTAARNPKLIFILNKMQFIENYGTGLKRIINSYTGFNKQPEFIVRENSFKVILYNKNYSSNTIRSSIYTNDESAVLTLLANATIPLSRKDIESSLDISTSKLHRLLSKLKENNKIKMIGNRRAAKYKIMQQ